ncbi:hypothetical protein [Methanosarcina barkeri]|nr:hypothetical protein [Methanosarcina barkeri]
MPQNPAGALNPVLKNRLQIEEVFEERGVNKKRGNEKIAEAYEKNFF